MMDLASSRRAMNTPHDEEKLDEGLDETFPASDPPANTVETGIRTGELSAVEPVFFDNRSLSRFELVVDGHTAFLTYERTADSLTLVHTEVPKPLRGRHLGETLVDSALEFGRQAGLRISVVCPFARVYLRRHPPASPPE
jgi:predicted GNAT family acetyltransferase